MKKKILIVSICVLLLLGCVAYVAAVSNGFEWPFSTAKEDCVHEYTAIVSKEATCTEPGVVVYSCAKCGHSVKQSQEAFGHPGVSKNKCIVCGESISESEGLEYASSPDGYIVAGIGICTDTIVIIPTTYNGGYVVGIGEQAFKGNDKITQVVIPDTVTTISSKAFADCAKLETVELSTALKQIGDEAFINCGKLKNVTFPEGLTYIGESAFKYCINIAVDSHKLVIPNSVTEIGKGAFFACYHIETLEIGLGIKNIAEDTFFCCIDVKTLILPKTLESVGNWAFFGCMSLEDVQFGGSMAQWNAIDFGDKAWGENEGYAPETVAYKSQG